MGQMTNTANVLIGYSQAVVQGYSAEVQIDWLKSVAYQFSRLR